jgi:aminoglycoside phosphotransferase family enzyme
MSWVFVAGDTVYKLKKPVCTDVLDYRTLDARRRCCEAEVTLNDALAPGIYLGISVLAGSDDHLQLDGPGEPREYLVRSRRLPAESSLAAEIDAGAIRVAEVRRLAERMATFHLAGRGSGLTPQRYQARLEAALGRRCGALGRCFGLPRPLVIALGSELLGFLSENQELLAQRAPMVVDGHGDPRPEHVFLLPEPVMIDRLEFDAELRLVDPADELAALDMECTRLGADWVGPELFAEWSRRSGDVPPPALLAFYRSARAVLRAKLAWEHTLDVDAGEREAWLGTAAEYLALAAHYAEALR